MLELVKYTNTQAAIWDDFADRYGSIFHTIAFKNLLQDCFGYECLYHYLADTNGQIKAILPLISARNIMQSKVGVSLPFINHLDFCTDGSISNQQLLDYLQELQEQYQLKYLQLRLREEPAANTGWQSNTDNYTFMLPLKGAEQDILALSSGSNRNHTRKVYKNNYFAVSFDPANLIDFYRVYQRRMHELGSPAPALHFFQAFFEYFPKTTHLLTVIDRATDKVVGGMLLVQSTTDKTLYYPYGANLVEYNNRYLNNFMYFEAAKFGQSLGMEWLDLGRSPLDSGTYRFKKQWGANPVSLHYLFYFGKHNAVIPSKESMSVFIKIWRYLPLGLVNFLGARLIKNVLP